MHVYYIVNTDISTPENKKNGLSTAAVAGITLVITLTVTLPAGVILGCSGAWCVWRRHGRGSSGQDEQQKLEKLQVQGTIYEEPDPGLVDTAIPLSENQAYGHVDAQRN